MSERSSKSLAGTAVDADKATKLSSRADRARPASKATAAASSPPHQRQRREQQRSIDTRRAILASALEEFAERGFDGASMRRIGERAGLDFTLITYHFRNKDRLWRAVAEWALGELFDRATPSDAGLSAKERVRVEFLAYFKFTVANPAFHSFMLRSSYGDEKRIQWLVENYLMLQRNRMQAQLEEAQADEGMIKGDPSLLYYLLLGSASSLASLGGEIALTTGYSIDDPKVQAAFWDIIERAFFR